MIGREGQKMTTKAAFPRKKHINPMDRQSVGDRIISVISTMTAAVILVPKVLMIFLNMPLTRFGDYLMSMTSTSG